MRVAAFSQHSLSRTGEHLYMEAIFGAFPLFGMMDRLLNLILDPSQQDCLGEWTTIMGESRTFPKSAAMHSHRGLGLVTKLTPPKHRGGTHRPKVLSNIGV